MRFAIEDGRKTFYQWDLNQKIVVDCDCNQIHFEQDGDTALVVEVSGMTAQVPNILLTVAKPIKAYAYVDSDNSHTKFQEIFNVIPRNKPDTYVYTETEVLSYEALQNQIDNIKGNIDPEAVKFVSQKLTDSQINQVYQNLRIVEGDKNRYSDVLKLKLGADKPQWDPETNQIIQIPVNCEFAISDLISPKTVLSEGIEDVPCVDGYSTNNFYGFNAFAYVLHNALTFTYFGGSANSFTIMAWNDVDVNMRHLYDDGYITNTTCLHLPTSMSSFYGSKGILPNSLFKFEFIESTGEYSPAYRKITVMNGNGTFVIEVFDTAEDLKKKHTVPAIENDIYDNVYFVSYPYRYVKENGYSDYYEGAALKVQNGTVQPVYDQAQWSDTFLGEQTLGEQAQAITISKFVGDLQCRAMYVDMTYSAGDYAVHPDLYINGLSNIHLLTPAIKDCQHLRFLAVLYDDFLKLQIFVDPVGYSASDIPQTYTKIFKKTDSVFKNTEFPKWITSVTMGTGFFGVGTPPGYYGKNTKYSYYCIFNMPTGTTFY